MLLIILFFSFHNLDLLHFHSHNCILSTIYQLFTKKHYNWFSEDSTFCFKGYSSAILILKRYWRISSKQKKKKNVNALIFWKCNFFFQFKLLYFISNATCIIIKCHKNIDVSFSLLLLSTLSLASLSLFLSSLSHSVSLSLSCS